MLSSPLHHPWSPSNPEDGAWNMRKTLMFPPLGSFPPTTISREQVDIASMSRGCVWLPSSWEGYSQGEFRTPEHMPHRLTCSPAHWSEVKPTQDMAPTSGSLASGTNVPTRRRVDRARDPDTTPDRSLFAQRSIPPSPSI